MCGTKQDGHCNTDPAFGIPQEKYCAWQYWQWCCVVFNACGCTLKWLTWGGHLWFSFVPVLCLAGLHTIVSLYLCKCSLYSCQSIICLQSTLWKKIPYFYLLFFIPYYLWEICVCVYMCTGIHDVSAFMWPMRAVEMLVPPPASFYKLITILRAHCNFRPVCDHLPIEI